MKKGGPQVATEKTFLSARAVEIAERRNTERDGDCKENGDWSKPGGEAHGGERIPRRATSFPTRDSYVCGPRIKVRLISPVSRRRFPSYVGRCQVSQKWKSPFSRGPPSRRAEHPKAARNLTGVKWLAFPR